jgi:hypothetical protein
MKRFEQALATDGEDAGAEERRSIIYQAGGSQLCCEIVGKSGECAGQLFYGRPGLTSKPGHPPMAKIQTK